MADNEQELLSEKEVNKCLEEAGIQPISGLLCGIPKAILKAQVAKLKALGWKSPAEVKQVNELADKLEEPRAVRLLAEWLAIDRDETRLQFEKYMTDAQELYEYITIIIGLPNNPDYVPWDREKVAEKYWLTIRKFSAFLWEVSWKNAPERYREESYEWADQLKEILTRGE